jgi:hypothetical protein
LLAEINMISIEVDNGHTIHSVQHKSLVNKPSSAKSLQNNKGPIITYWKATN